MEPKFKIGDRVRKISGSSWQGVVVGTYSTKLTPEGYAVESEYEDGSVQIYPAKALELAPHPDTEKLSALIWRARATAAELEVEKLRLALKYYACDCAEGACEVCDTDSVTCGRKARSAVEGKETK